MSFPLMKRWLPFAAYVILICWLSLTPSPPVIKDDFFGWDKLQHAGAYFIFTLLAGRALETFSLERKRRWLLAALVAAVFGGALEIVQGVFTATRTAEWGDLLADVIGAACAYVLMRIKEN
jgi:VanZ family protein